jgi:tRNA(Ile)-lysidine synthase
VTEDLIERVRAGGLLAEGRPVVVLLSGGRDSICLLDLAVRVAGEGAVTALHLNYGLREAAADDEMHCAQVSERLCVPLVVGRPNRPDKGNLQAWAREERYRAAGELAEPRGADVAAGHTATDQVETILYRLASSPSRRALLGMAPREGRLIRPLLGVSREQTAAYCRGRGLEWREDETNDSGVFARGRVRHGLMPALEAVHPAAAQNVLALAETLRDEGAILDGLVDEVLEGRAAVELTRLRALPAALRRLVVQRLADGAVGRPAPGAARRADEVAALSEHGSAALDLPHGVRAVAEQGVVRFVRQPDDRRGRRSGAVGRRATGSPS